VADDSGSTQPSKPERFFLSETERVFAGLIGAGILAWAAVLLFSPPEHNELISGCKATNPTDCVPTVSSIPESVTSVVVAAGAVLILVALLGIRFSSIKAGPISLGATATDSSKDDAEEAADKDKAKPVVQPELVRGFAARGRDEAAMRNQLEAWALVPPEIRAAAIRRWRAQGKAGDPATQIEQVYAPAPGHSDWYIAFLDGSTYRVTAGAT
jgi:hypothetical protein